MGKASSNKKVARAAKAGGGRARAAGERNIVFPAALALVVVLGTLLVLYARDNRSATALEPPIAFEDHWHSAYGIYVCDEFLPDLPEFTAPQNGGTHTHGDGLIHVHPFSSARAGENATLTNWFLDAGAVLGGGDELSETTLAVPGGDAYVEGETECQGVEEDAKAPIVQVAVWDSAIRALEGDDPDRVVTEEFDSIRFDKDGAAYTVAYAPEGAELPPPQSLEGLRGVGSDLGVPESELPEDAELDDDFGEPTQGETTDTTAGDTTDTTAGEPTDTTTADDTSATTEPES